MIDLAEAGTPSRRFVERVCAPAELLALGTAPPPARVWALFAAKEAAFKAHSKRFPRAIFSPRSFVVSPDASRVRHPLEQFRLALLRGPGFIHALAYTGEIRPQHRVGRIVEPESESSAARRLLYALAAGRLAAAGDRLELVRSGSRAAPRLLAGGRALPCDVSLSHHGGLAACALLVLP